MESDITFQKIHATNIYFAIQIWGQSLNHNSRLTKLQKSAIRLITFSNFQADSVPIFKELCIPPTYNIVLTFNIKLAHKTLNFESATAVQEILDLKYTQNSYSTRTTFLKLLARPYVRTTTFGYKSNENKNVIYWKTLQSNNKNVDLATQSFYDCKTDQQIP